MWEFDLFSSNTIATYVKLTPNNSQRNFEDKLNSIVDKYHAVGIEKTLGIEYSQFLADGKTYKYSLMPLTKMHFEAEGLRTKFEKLGVYKNIYSLSIISLIALFIGSINFINLSTARSSNRGKEVGIRKVSGSGKSQLIKQFLLESLMLSFFSMLLAVTITAILLPYFNSFLDTSIALPNIVFTWVMPAVLAITVLVGFIAGIYPAYILSALKPALIIKGNYGNSTSGKGIIRNIFVLFQYGISIIFIMGTLIIQSQLKLMHNKDLGYDIEQVLKLSGMRGESPGRYLTFKQGLLKINGVKSVSSGDDIFGRNGRGWRMNLRTIGSSRGEGSEIIHGAAGIDLIENFQLKIISDKILEVPDRGYFLTESAVKELKLTNPVGEYLIGYYPTDPGKINPDWDTLMVCGVIQDFQYRSALNKIEPVALVVSNRMNGRAMNSIFVKLTGNSIQQTVAEIETIWKDLGPDEPFTYTFLDLEIDKFYSEEQKLSKLIGLFSLLSIIISCLGILGLSAYLAQQKNKEISIRKILGASLNQIVDLLVRKHAILILAAIFIFMPIAYLLAQKWLSNYPYRITVDALTILTTIAAIIIITGISISWQLIRGVRVNPLEAIKSE
jgi:putative ABC transport system permease protein